MIPTEALYCLVPLCGLALLLWVEHERTLSRFQDVGARLRNQGREISDLCSHCRNRQFLENMDARLIGLESKLDHLTRLLSTLVEIRNGLQKT